MCAEPTSLAVLMAKTDKYATADSAMRIKVTALDKVVPAPATPKPAGDNRGGQNNYKRKADQMDPRSNNMLVANVEGEASASQAGPPRKRRNQGNPNWLPKHVASHAGCRKGRACQLLRVCRWRPVHRLPITLRFRRHRLAMTVLTLATILITTERSSSSPEKAMTNTACAKDGAR
ncbi:hypothetical protein D1007_36822 [Hordeum vulgare]|nr:hypothetical protein D1007_36822 [Hordeum vulgare]